MNRHAFRWRGLVFALLFLTVAGNWAVWEQDLLTRQEFSFTLSGVLIIAGTLGVIATFWRPRTAHPAVHRPATTDTTLEENHETADPQS